ncbi:hypothetical protein [Chryseobacterium sp. MP_3.2]|uniref:hypothetical protein n=1 Tax=Chryseobacterium sp. MP_3.2 TaxID=3071712 RepID=UPI002E05F192|nr:hypothetical protein [Chryseobacterium sp. MP_3.2]
MKKLALIAAVVFTTLTIQSCRQTEDVLSPEEIMTLQRVQNSSDNILKNADPVNTGATNTSSLVDGEIVPPPKK